MTDRVLRIPPPNSEHRAGVVAEDPGDRLLEGARALVLVGAHGPVVGGDQSVVGLGGGEPGERGGHRRVELEPLGSGDVGEEPGGLRLERVGGDGLTAGVAVAQGCASTR